jgi:hypothetical protein
MLVSLVRHLLQTPPGFSPMGRADFLLYPYSQLLLLPQLQQVSEPKEESLMSAHNGSAPLGFVRLR